METRKLPFSSAPMDDRNLPDVHLGLYDDVIVFDHVEKVLFEPFLLIISLSILFTRPMITLLDWLSLRFFY